jgi:hypothetical protein
MISLFYLSLSLSFPLFQLPLNSLLSVEILDVVLTFNLGWRMGGPFGFSTHDSYDTVIVATAGKLGAQA